MSGFWWGFVCGWGVGAFLTSFRWSLRARRSYSEGWRDAMHQEHPPEAASGRRPSDGE